MFFYNYESKHLDILKDSFIKNSVTEKYFVEDTPISSLTYSLYKTRADSDAFDLLDIYGQEQEGILKIVNVKEGISVNEFVDEFSRESVFE